MFEERKRKSCVLVRGRGMQGELTMRVRVVGVVGKGNNH